MARASVNYYSTKGHERNRQFIESKNARVQRDVGRANGKSVLDVNGCISSPWNVLLLTLNAELIQAQVLEANLE